jgi:hypothetical protein
VQTRGHARKDLWGAGERTDERGDRAMDADDSSLGNFHRFRIQAFDRGARDFFFFDKKLSVFFSGIYNNNKLLRWSDQIFLL